MFARSCKRGIIQTAGGDIAVLPANIGLDGIAPRSRVDTANIAAGVAGTVQHGCQNRPERVTMRVLVGPTLARQTAVRHVDCTAVVASIALVTVNCTVHNNKLIRKLVKLLPRQA